MSESGALCNIDGHRSARTHTHTHTSPEVLEDTSSSRHRGSELIDTCDTLAHSSMARGGPLLFNYAQPLM